MQSIHGKEQLRGASIAAIIRQAAANQEERPPRPL